MKWCSFKWQHPFKIKRNFRLNNTLLFKEATVEITNFMFNFMEGAFTRKMFFYFELGYSLLKLIQENSYWKERGFQKRIAIWKKFYTVLYSAFWQQRSWETHKVEQETSFFKGGLFENNIFYLNNLFHFKRMLLFERTSSFSEKKALRRRNLFLKRKHSFEKNIVSAR